MDTTLTLLVDWDAKLVYVDGSLVELDELNAAEINVSKIIESRNRMPSTVRLQTDLENRYTKEQIIAIFKLWGNSNTFTLRTTAEVLNVGKAEAMKILLLGIEYDVLSRGFNSAWKTQNRLIRESLLACVENLLKENKPRRNAEDILHEKIDTWKKEREENEQSGNMSEPISEEESEEPAQIKVGMKGESKRTGKGTVKSMSELSKQQTPSLLILPKKKPLQSPTQVPKKPHKPAKR